MIKLIPRNVNSRFGLSTGCGHSTDEEGEDADVPPGQKWTTITTSLFHT